MINAGEKGWEPLLPTVVSNMIKEKQLFGFSENRKNLIVLF